MPYHWGRFRGLAERMQRPPLDEHLMRNVFFDTCVYHQPGIDLLTAVISPSTTCCSPRRCWVRSAASTPRPARAWDDTRKYVDQAPLDESSRAKVYELNARRVYPRLAARLDG